MPDTPENQARYPQQGGQKPGVGFPIARLVAVTSLAHGAVLDVAMGPYKGKGTGEHSLFRELLKLAYNLIRLLMMQAAVQAHVLPR